jgi:hypothetical protein
MEILAGEIADSIVIDPHLRHARGSCRGAAPHPMLIDSGNDLRVVSMLNLPLRGAPTGESEVRAVSHILQQFTVLPYHMRPLTPSCGVSLTPSQIR